MDSKLSHIRSLTGLNFLLGVWLTISPYLLGYTSSTAKWTQTSLGIVILLLASIRYTFPNAQWADWLNGLAGVWLMLTPWLLGYGRTSAYWNDVIIGAAVAVIAFWGSSNYSHTSSSHA